MSVWERHPRLQLVGNCQASQNYQHFYNKPIQTDPLQCIIQNNKKDLIQPFYSMGLCQSCRPKGSEQSGLLSNDQIHLSHRFILSLESLNKEKLAVNLTDRDVDEGLQAFHIKPTNTRASIQYNFQEDDDRLECEVLERIVAPSPKKVAKRATRAQQFFSPQVERRKILHLDVSDFILPQDLDDTESIKGILKERTSKSRSSSKSQNSRRVHFAKGTRFGRVCTTTRRINQH